MRECAGLVNGAIAPERSGKMKFFQYVGIACVILFAVFLIKSQQKSVSAGGTDAYAAETLLNDSFSVKSTNWSAVSSSASYLVKKSYVYGGSSYGQSLYISSKTQKSWQISSNTISAVQSGDVLNLSAVLKTSRTSVAGVSITYLDANKNVIGTSSSSTQSTSGSWSSVNQSVTVPSGVSYAQVAINGSGSGSTYVDNVVLTKEPAPTQTTTTTTTPTTTTPDTSAPPVAAPNTIKVYFNNALGTMNPKVLGTNLLGHLEGSDYVQYSPDFGAGVWDPQAKAPTASVLSLVKSAKIGAMRFPGGMGANSYNWKSAIGTSRSQYLFGIHEFLKTSELAGAVPIFTVNCSTLTESDAANLVEYLNAANDGSHPWAAKRAQNGHAAPFGVKYFEIGNEIYDTMSAEAYAALYLKFYDAMKAVDPTVQVGVVLREGGWAQVVIGSIKSKVDFGIFHVYPTPSWQAAELQTMSANDIFLFSLAQTELSDQRLWEEARMLFKQATGGRDVPLAITEFNGGYVNDSPVPYRLTLGCALVNAELLRLFSKPSNNIVMANNWNLANEYWGMISNNFWGNQIGLTVPYYKRPNYLAFELYAGHFGSTLLKTDLSGPQYEFSGKDAISATLTGTVASSNLVSGTWKVTPVSGVSVTQSGGVVTVDFQKPSEFNYFHTYQTANVEPNTYYRVSGFVKADNLVDAYGVGINILDSRGYSETRPAVMTATVKGTTDWVYVAGLYPTTADTTSLSVMVRRVGETGPLTGKASVKGVVVEKLIPTDAATKVTYLSANASKSADGSKMYLIVVNKDLTTSQTATITLDGFVPASQANAYVLNGPSISATNETTENNVKITPKTFSVPLSGTFNYTFEPHSVTALEFDSMVLSGGTTAG